jgi:hypothetical protein
MMTATTASHGATTARTPAPGLARFEWRRSLRGQNEFKRLPDAT